MRTILDIAPPVPAVDVDAQAVLHAYEAVVKGKPVVERIIALGGSGFHENFFLKTRVGAQLADIVSPRMRNAENRIILGGIMTGKICDDLSTPVDRTAASIAILDGGRGSEFLSFLRPGSDRDSFTNSFLSSLFPMAKRKIDPDLNGEHRPCIYCNYCESVCPAGLMPYLLSKYVTHDMLEDAENLGILDCIDCGLCTYVCPSKISIMTNIHNGKMQIREDKQ